jgi:hypothetical protein
MRLGLLCIVLSLVGGTTTACATGLSGAAVGAPPSKAPPPPIGTNLLLNGDFTSGTSPWVSNEAAHLLVTNRRRWVRSAALLLRPATPGSYFSAKAVVLTAPSKNQRYSFEAWVQGSPDLVGAPVQVELGALQMTGPATGQMVTVAQKYRPLGRHWRHFSVQGVVPFEGAVNLTAIVAVQSRSKHSWLALQDVAVTQLRPPRSHVGHGNGRS